MSEGKRLIDIHRVPDELKQTPNWCIAAPDKSPYTVTGHRANVTSPHTWGEFDDMVEVAAKWGAGSGVGFVLAAGCGYVCIDLDVKDDTPPEVLARYDRIIQTFDSYTERSTSGRGFHIWLRGYTGVGHRRDGVEVYSQERFIVCTGDVHLDRPIREAGETLNLLIQEMQPKDTKAELKEQEAVEDDAVVWQRACTAENADKFKALCGGDWRGMGYPSQSEADLSLLSMLAFYSKSNEQVRRMFRATELGQRPKASRNDTYLNRTLTIIRGRQEREEQFQKATVQQASALADKLSKPTIDLVQATATVAPRVQIEAPNLHALPWPPGFVGEIAKWFYAISPRPVQEIAIVSALGLFAGIFGRAVQINGSGVNLYLVLVARSAIGKEALHTSVSKLIQLTHSVPAISGRVDFSDYASGPALIKAFGDGRTSFVNIAGEWGRKLKKISDDTAEGPMSSLRTVMTNLYQKSGAGTIVGGIGYSDKEKNIKSVDGVAYSMVGETTPDNFYESLTNTMMQDGFLSRFVVVEYAGLRPALNMYPDAPIDPNVLGHMIKTGNFLDTIGPMAFVPARMDLEAAAILEEFDKECDKQINSTMDESWRQMWNRAHLKALKVSAILAAADNVSDPLITKVQTDWALDLIRRDIRTMSRKIHDGDVGDNDVTRERKVLAIMREYLQEPLTAGYAVPAPMRGAGVVPRKYLLQRTQRVNSFLKHKLGSNKALDDTIRSLCDSGYIVEVPRTSIPSDWGFVGKCYRILSLPDVM